MRKKFNRHLKYNGKNNKKASNKTYLLLAVIAAGGILGVYFILSGFPNDGNILKKETVVCIDAGHGGKDMGASLGDRLEKDDNLKLAKLVQTQLESSGIKTVMTGAKRLTGAGRISLLRFTGTAPKAEAALKFG